MKAKLLFIFLAIAPIGLFAQSKEETTISQSRHQYVTNRFWDNWFISAGVGGQVYFGEDDHIGSFGKRVAPALDIAVGKWFTPGLGLRLQYSGLKLKGYSKGQGWYLSNQPDVDGNYTQKWDYMNLHGDVMFNVVSMIAGYNEKRIYEPIPYLGFGYVHSYEGTHDNEFATNVGILNRFRLSSALDINLDVRGTLVPQEFDGQVGGRRGEGFLTATVGLTYKFKTRGFKSVSTSEVISTGISVSEMQAITDKLKEQEAYTRRLQDELNNERNKKQEPTIKTETISVTRTVFFDLNEAEISAKEKINLKFTAEQIKKSPSKKYTITGYADKATGTTEYNQTLSEKRAQNVFNILVKEYNVNPNQLTVSGKGGTNSLFDGNSLNRVVIVE